MQNILFKVTLTITCTFFKVNNILFSLTEKVTRSLKLCIEEFSIEFRETKSNVIILANHKGRASESRLILVYF